MSRNTFNRQGNKSSKKILEQTMSGYENSEEPKDYDNPRKPFNDGRANQNRSTFVKRKAAVPTPPKCKVYVDNNILQSIRTATGAKSTNDGIECSGFKFVYGEVDSDSVPFIDELLGTNYWLVHLPTADQKYEFENIWSDYGEVFDHILYYTDGPSDLPNKVFHNWTDALKPIGAVFTWGPSPRATPSNSRSQSPEPEISLDRNVKRVNEPRPTEKKVVKQEQKKLEAKEYAAANQIPPYSVPKEQLNPLKPPDVLNEHAETRVLTVLTTGQIGLLWDANCQLVFPSVKDIPFIGAYTLNQVLLVKVPCVGGEGFKVVGITEGKWQVPKCTYFPVFSIGVVRKFLATETVVILNELKLLTSNKYYVDSVAAPVQSTEAVVEDKVE